jgi:bifunctional DNA-binding transcriptional regulator/antitoxin component of YhaV-PrlF toxin-antitoxin module
MSILRRMRNRNQITLPSKLLQAIGVSEEQALFSIEAKDGRIVLEPRQTEVEPFSEESWGQLDHLVQKQVKNKQFTQYEDGKKAKKHLDRFRK